LFSIDESGTLKVITNYDIHMKTLVIYAHPYTQGYCSTILEEVETILKNKKNDYEIIDLYRLGYDPILHENEHFTAGNRDISAENISYQEKIKNSDLLIFIYPVWWGTMPAILKGFCDRVLTPRFAYRYEGAIPQRLLKGKRAIVFMTSGSPVAYFWISGNRPWLNIKWDILWFCGISSRVVQFGRCRKFDPAMAGRLKKKVQSTLCKI
jgi:NAD(P)H dehydrogenase (quinone)